MKKNLIFMFIVCLCLCFVGCSPDASDTVKLDLYVSSYTTETDFRGKIPGGVAYTWSDSKGKSGDGTYLGESSSITIYPTKNSTVNIEMKWTPTSGSEQTSTIKDFEVGTSNLLTYVGFGL